MIKKAKNNKYYLIILSFILIFLGIYLIYKDKQKDSISFEEKFNNKNICILKIQKENQNDFLYYTNNRIFVEAKNCNTTYLPIFIYKNNLILNQDFIAIFFEKWQKLWQTNEVILDSISEVIIDDRKLRVYLSFNQVVIDINDITKKNWENSLLATIIWLINNRIKKGYIDLSDEYGLVIYSGDI